MIKKGQIVAIDFDATLSTYIRPWGFDKLGNPIEKVIKLIQWLYDQGCYIMIFTGRMATPKLAKWLEKNKVPYEILMGINKISDATKIQVGQNIKILNGPFHAKVYRSTFTIDVYLKNTYVRTFKVGLGVSGSETPTGMWKVKVGGKLIEPVWTDPQGKTHYPSDPDYPLGSRWIALEGVSGQAVGKQGFAIHGTHEPESLGIASSQGCIRMENGEAVLVYNMLFPGYSTVEVLD